MDGAVDPLESPHQPGKRDDQQDRKGVESEHVVQVEDPPPPRGRPLDPETLGNRRGAPRPPVQQPGKEDYDEHKRGVVDDCRADAGRQPESIVQVEDDISVINIENTDLIAYSLLS